MDFMSSKRFKSVNSLIIFSFAGLLVNVILRYANFVGIEYGSS